MREGQAYQLDQAIEQGDDRAVARLLDTEPRLTGTPMPVGRDWGEEMWLGLHRAARLGRAEIVSALLDAGASIDARTRFRTPMHGRETALLIAARQGHAPVARLLLDRHADPDLLDATHRAALSHAAGAGHDDVVALLIERGAAVDPVDDQQRTPLHWAIVGGHATAAIALIDAGADVNHRCPKEPAGYTPLHRCVSVGDAMQAVAERLIKAGADQTLRDPRFGKTAGELRV
jgi:ankyrin repeat protein